MTVEVQDARRGAMVTVKLREDRERELHSNYRDEKAVRGATKNK